MKIFDLIFGFKKPNKPKGFEEEIIEPVKAPEKTKNKWLYPTNEFGKMEEGVVDDLKIYGTYISKDEEQQEFIIINKKSTKK